jgi:predicted MFS family arabinose efflux permease
MIERRLVWGLGVSQLVLWGVSYYLVGVFGERIARDLGWSQALVFGGFSAALTVMGLVSAPVGRLIDRHGGRPVMAMGSVLTALGCVGIALAHGPVLFYASWLLLGVAMRMALYDAAFATLARIGGPAARRPISGITLLGGLASTSMWPVGEALAAVFGWRGAVLCYAAFALATLPLHLAIAPGRYERPTEPGHAEVAPLATTPGDRILASLLYALVAMLTSFLNSAMSAHMIGILSGLGMAAALAVWVSTLRGIGQSLARFTELVFGRKLNPLMLGVLATAVMPLGFVAGLFGGVSLGAGITFAFLYGAGNGLTTIVRGTQPLVLFDPRDYGTLVGRLIAPGFFLSALAPVLYALTIEHYGYAAALHLSLAVALLTFAAAAALWLRFARRAPGGNTSLGAAL